MLLPALNKARASARTTTCVNNMKQLGLGIAQYTSDFNDWYPRIILYTTPEKMAYEKFFIENHYVGHGSFLCPEAMTMMDNYYRKLWTAKSMEMDSNNGWQYANYALNIWELGLSPTTWSARTKITEVRGASRFLVAGEGYGSGLAQVPYDRLSNYCVGSTVEGYYSPWPWHGLRTNTLRGDGHVQAVHGLPGTTQAVTSLNYYKESGPLKAINYDNNPWSYNGEARSASSGIGNRQRN
ncbi:MAG: DUF1559 domain-containing protein [Fibrobacteraceae bacterium]